VCVLTHLKNTYEKNRTRVEVAAAVTRAMPTDSPPANAISAFSLYYSLELKSQRVFSLKLEKRVKSRCKVGILHVDLGER